MLNNDRGAIAYADAMSEMHDDCESKGHRLGNHQWCFV